MYERPDWDLNPGLELRRLQGYPLPYRGVLEKGRGSAALLVNVSLHIFIGYLSNIKTSSVML